MDSAEAERLSEVLRTQEACLNRQEEFQTAMAANMGQLSSQHKSSGSTLPPRTPTSPETNTHSGGASCKLAPPAQYSGEPRQCKTFLIDCLIHFELMPHAFPTERAKVAFMISHLTGQAKAWVSAKWSRSSAVCDTIAGFQAALTKTFDHVSYSREKAQELSTLKQGKASMCDYSVPHPGGRKRVEYHCAARHFPEGTVTCHSIHSHTPGSTHEPRCSHRSRHPHR